MRWWEPLPEPNDGSPPIPPAIWLRERVEAYMEPLSCRPTAAYRRLHSRRCATSGAGPGRVRDAESQLWRQEARIAISWIRPLYEACSVPEARIERRRK
jgi:hypothetical protein